MRAFALFVVLSWSTMSAPAWAQHHPEMPDMNHGGHSDPSLQPSEAPQDDVEEGPMDHGSMTTTPTLEVVGDDPAPDPPLDHAADSVFDPAVMEHARDQLSREHGRSLITKVMLNLAEFRVQDAGTSGYRWEGEGRVGGNINRLVIKTEGEGGVQSGLESAELHALYSRAISPFFDLQVGVRQDFEPTTRRTYAHVAFEGLAPYWFNVQGALFVSDHGDVLARTETSYDIRLFQRVVLQPQAEMNLAAQDVPEMGIGSGLTSLELGLRIRYELRREFAPYIGFTYDQLFGDTRNIARDSGDDSSNYGFVVGLRAWF